jgi:hypothetical protein
MAREEETSSQPPPLTPALTGEWSEPTTSPAQAGKLASYPSSPSELTPRKMVLL